MDVPPRLSSLPSPSRIKDLLDRRKQLLRKRARLIYQLGRLNRLKGPYPGYPWPPISRRELGEDYQELESMDSDDENCTVTGSVVDLTTMTTPRQPLFTKRPRKAAHDKDVLTDLVGGQASPDRVKNKNHGDPFLLFPLSDTDSDWKDSVSCHTSPESQGGSVSDVFGVDSSDSLTAGTSSDDEQPPKLEIYDPKKHGRGLSPHSYRQNPLSIIRHSVYLERKKGKENVRAERVLYG